MAFSEEYKAGLRGDSSPGIDTFSYSYQMGAQDRDKQARAGGGDANGGTGGGMILAVLAVILAFLGFVLAICIYPIAGIATGIAFGIGVVMLNGDGHNTMNGVGLVFALMVPCYIVFVLSMMVERKVQSYRLYRVIRQYWRIVVGTFAIHTLGTAFHLKSTYPQGAPFSGYVIDALMTATGPFLTYLNSMRLDRKYEFEPVRIKWLDYVVNPFKDRLIPRVPVEVQETGMLRAKTDNGETINVSVGPGGIVTLGKTQIPVGNIREIEIERNHRGPLVAAGVILFFMGPVLVKQMFGGFNSFMAQTIGLAGIVASLCLVLLGFYQKTPAGKLAGPFRYLSIWYAETEDIRHMLSLRFDSARDERMFTQAVANGLKAMRRIEPPTVPGTVQEAPSPAS